MSGTPRVLVVEHEADCPPALLGRWLAEAGATLEICRPYAGDPVPTAVTGYDGLLVLGGEMGAGDDAAYPWLGPTRDLVRTAAAAGLPCLGTCLGHQLAAVALGGRAGRNPRAEEHVGLVEVGWTADAAADPLLGPLLEPIPADLPVRHRALHWNRDLVLELPSGARLLATTPEGDVQAARLAPTVWGVQWHPEVDESVVASWVAAERETQERVGTPGPDRSALLAEVAAARVELVHAWQPLGAHFVRLAAARGVHA